MGLYFYCRVRGLLQSGAIQEVDKPVWYDVYEAFPPVINPKYERFQEDREPRNILYKEDIIRE
jgi:small subunit ribosomal protein S23